MHPGGCEPRLSHPGFLGLPDHRAPRRAASVSALLSPTWFCKGCQAADPDRGDGAFWGPSKSARLCAGERVAGSRALDLSVLLARPAAPTCDPDIAGWASIAPSAGQQQGQSGFNFAFLQWGLAVQLGPAAAHAGLLGRSQRPPASACRRRAAQTCRAHRASTAGLRGAWARVESVRSRPPGGNRRPDGACADRTLAGLGTLRVSHLGNLAQALGGYILLFLLFLSVGRSPLGKPKRPSDHAL